MPNNTLINQINKGDDMEIKSDKMCANEIRKVALILTRISDKLGWDISGYGFADVNQSSGNTYVWLEDYPVTPYIGLSGDNEICYLWTCPECGEEIDIPEAKVKAEVYPKKCKACGKSV